MRTEYREEPCRSALNRVRGMPFEWSLNPYMGCAHRCTFCYVRAFERRADRAWGRLYGASVRVKTNVAEILVRELARPSWSGSEVVIGAATDPYQPAEGRYRLTRACIEALAARANPFGIITRGPLIARDRELLKSASGVARVSVHISVPTLDETLWRATEPGTAPPLQRLRAARLLADAGVRVSIALAPLIPGLTDDEPGMTEVVRAARDAGAAGVWAGLLYLKSGTREHFLDELGREWPSERLRLEEIYRGRAYADRAHGAAMGAKLSALRKRFPLPADAPPLVRPRPRVEPPAFALQLGLALP